MKNIFTTLWGKLQKKKKGNRFHLQEGAEVMSKTFVATDLCFGAGNIFQLY